MDAGRLDALSSLVAYKKNVILYGAPGVGKTYAAKRLAYAIMGQKDDTRIEMVQFHQNYSYEDFILGFKPHEESFQLQQGVFYRFCQKAQKDSQRPYFFIIDEINRGNLSKIFGELLLLIEKDYRGFPITLAYGDTPFSVPPNICILATMNNADRSLAMIDYALRRRFSFFEMAPGFSAPGFAAYQKKLQSPLFNALIEQIKALNEEIEKEPSLGKGFLIGHSYFCGPDMDKPQRLKQVVQFDIVPMLEEYWFDQPQKALFWQERLNGVFA